MTHTIQFRHLEDLLAFLNACERREIMGQDQTDETLLYEWIHLDDGPLYGVGFTENAWPRPEAERRRVAENFGGEILTNTTPRGVQKHLNELLLHLPLKGSVIRVAQITSVVLACPPGPGVGEANLHQLLRTAWWDLPKAEDTVSEFFLVVPKKAAAWPAVLVRHLDPGFEPEAFRRAHPAPLQLFAPVWEGEDCFLFVQWGYEYPKPADFYELYDETRSGGVSGRQHIVLATAGPVVERSTIDQAHGAWFRSNMLVVEGDATTRIENICNVEVREDCPVVIAPREELPGDQLCVLPLTIGETGHALGALNELEKLIGQHERELELLQVRRARLTGQLHHDYLVVYRFRQPAGAGRLPGALEQFLKRPLGELAHYRYARVTTKANDHYLAGELPIGLAAALAVPADHTYLCDARWVEWGLRLFVRSDCTLSVNIDERGLAERVVDLLKEAGVGESDKFVLAEPVEEQAGPDGMCPVRLTVLEAPQQLDEVLRFTNDQSSGPANVARLATVLEPAAVVAHDVVVADTTQQLDETLLGRANDLISVAETKWEETRRTAQQVLLAARVADVLLEQAHSIYEAAPNSWQDFVNEVLRTDERIADLKLQALAEWHEHSQTREQRLAAVQAAQTDIEAEIRARDQELGDQLETARQVNQSLQGEVDQVTHLHQQLTNALTQLAALKAQLETRVQNLRGQRDAVEREASQNQALLGQLRAYHNQLAQDQQACDINKASLERELPDLKNLAKSVSRWIKEVEKQLPSRRRWWHRR